MHRPDTTGLYIETGEFMLYLTPLPTTYSLGANGRFIMLLILILLSVPKTAWVQIFDKRLVWTQLTARVSTN